jgi:hypothetical protein
MTEEEVNALIREKEEGRKLRLSQSLDQLTERFRQEASEGRVAPLIDENDLKLIA